MALSVILFKFTKHLIINPPSTIYFSNNSMEMSSIVSLPFLSALNPYLGCKEAKPNSYVDILLSIA